MFTVGRRLPRRATTLIAKFIPFHKKGDRIEVTPLHFCRQNRIVLRPVELSQPLIPVIFKTPDKIWLWAYIIYLPGWKFFQMSKDLIFLHDYRNIFDERY